jgi:predicted DNA-binding transcriptional regulator AlpA
LPRTDANQADHTLEQEATIRAHEQRERRRPRITRRPRARRDDAENDTNLAPPRKPPSVRLLDKHDILEITRVSYPTIWARMRDGSFPRSRVLGGKSMWRSDEVEAWLAALPVRRLKGDDGAR